MDDVLKRMLSTPEQTEERNKRIDRKSAYEAGYNKAKEDALSIAKENKKLRLMLCIAHAGAGAYLDDGEMQDNTKHPAIDWKRDALDVIKTKLHERARIALLDVKKGSDDD